MKRCLVTGATGFVGKHLVSYLLEHTDWDIFCVSRYIFVKSNSRLTIMVHDLSEPLPDIGNFDYVVNLASMSHIEDSIQNPVHCLKNNFLITLNLLEYCRDHRPKVFLQFSTIDTLNPSNPYTASKGIQELTAMSYWKTYDMPIVITTSANIIGEGQSKKNFVPKVIDLIKYGQEVPIYTSAGEIGVRYWNPVFNVCSAIRFILALTPASPDQVGSPSFYPLMGGKKMDNLEMALLIAEKLDMPLKFKKIDVEHIRPGYEVWTRPYIDTLKDLGWKAPQTLEEGLSWF